MTRGWNVGLLMVAALGCRAKDAAVADPAAPAAQEAPAAAPVTPGTQAPTKTAAAPAKGEVAVPAEDLQSEEREQNPRSEMVKLKLMVSPTVPGTVFWGIRKLGPTGPKPLELDRPRNSGPLDIVVKADGYLPFHARLFTDRDDKLAIHLVRNDEASHAFGFRRGKP